MDKPPAQTTPILKFGGMFSDTDPGDVPEEMLWRQMNCFSIRNGELTTRGGLREVTVETLE